MMRIYGAYREKMLMIKPMHWAVSEVPYERYNGSADDK